MTYDAVNLGRRVGSSQTSTRCRFIIKTCLPEIQTCLLVQKINVKSVKRF